MVERLQWHLTPVNHLPHSHCLTGASVGGTVGAVGGVLVGQRVFYRPRRRPVFGPSGARHGPKRDTSTSKNR